MGKRGMKPRFWAIVALLLAPLLTLTLYAAGVDTGEPTYDDWLQFLMSLKGVAGIGTLGVAGVAVQGLLLLFRSKFVKMDGKQKLMVVQFLSVLAGMVGLRTQGIDWAAAFLHANTLGAVQVFAHQIYKQFFDRSSEKYALPSK